MKFQSPLLVVTDMEKSKSFYKEILGLRVTMDLGANVTLTGGVALQTKDSWMEFIDQEESGIVFHGNDAELYFEEDDFDGFLKKLSSVKEIQYVHPLKEHSWGQRVVRFYDPDHHIIEVGENMKVVCRHFLDSGMTVEETAKRMGVPVTFVRKSC
ncbi:VOC family protein [Clostridium sp. Marseille-P2415]|uniref:VOC family protein n=1 Tax=Clostridium sp. Marseille-P2415 TaxID=1805471 RepID=UPI0009887418|nr:VOC family protein [Clostridium sp. Marseille-P2415]